MENKRRKIHEELEVVKEVLQMGLPKDSPFTDQEKSRMIR